MFLKSLNNRVSAPEKSIHVNIGSIWDCFDPLMVWVDVKAKDLKKSWPWIFLKCTQNINWLKRIFQWDRVSRWHLSPSQQGPTPLLQPSFQSDLCKKTLRKERGWNSNLCQAPHRSCSPSEGTAIKTFLRQFPCLQLLTAIACIDVTSKLAFLVMT